MKVGQQNSREGGEPKSRIGNQIPGAEGWDLASTHVLHPPTSMVPIYRGESRGAEQRCIWDDF